MEEDFEKLLEHKEDGIFSKHRYISVINSAFQFVLFFPKQQRYVLGESCCFVLNFSYIFNTMRDNEQDNLPVPPGLYV